MGLPWYPQLGESLENRYDYADPPAPEFSREPSLGDGLVLAVPDGRNRTYFLTSMGLQFSKGRYRTSLVPGSVIKLVAAWRRDSGDTSIGAQ